VSSHESVHIGFRVESTIRGPKSIMAMRPEGWHILDNIADNKACNNIDRKLKLTEDRVRRPDSQPCRRV